ncbi:MAG TPA: GNAT family N-acetyltransferase [Acidimicrobiia bacterium]|nr:GNAT family N-acetyltransferase [Acidimicrobiia bacterium]
MSLRWVDAGPELAEVESLASDWSESPHHPALSEHTLLQLRLGNAAVLVSENRTGLASLSPTKQAGIGMVEVAVPDRVSMSDFWDLAAQEVESEAVRLGYRALDLLTWDAGLRAGLTHKGWRQVRIINRGMTDARSIPVSSDSAKVGLFQRERDFEGLLEVNNLAFGGHPEAGDWDHAGLESLFRETWFDPTGLFVTRQGSVVSGFCWTKVHADSVGEIYLLAVRPSHSGRGLGRALLTTGIEYLTTARGSAMTMIYWDTSNKAASSLYQSVGFNVDRVGEVFRHLL